MLTPLLEDTSALLARLGDHIGTSTCLGPPIAQGGSDALVLHDVRASLRDLDEARALARETAARIEGDLIHVSNVLAERATCDQCTTLRAEVVETGAAIDELLHG